MTTAILDGHFFLHRMLHVPELSKLRTSKGISTGAVFGVTKSLCTLLSSFSTITRVVFVLDDGLSKRRLDLDPNYKSGRRSRKPQDQLTAEDRQYLVDFAVNRKYAKFLLSKLGVKVVELPGREADDLIAMITRYQALSGPNALVVSEDKDLLQLVDQRVHVHRPIASDYISLDNFREMVGCPKELYLISRAILGDKSDSIPGVKGTGEKSVETIIQETLKLSVRVHPPGMTVTPDMWLDLVMTVCADSKNKKICQVSQPAWKDRVRLNLKLMDLSLEQWTGAEWDQVQAAVTAPPVLDHGKAHQCLSSLEAAQLVSTYTQWSGPFARLQ